MLIATKSSRINISEEKKTKSIARIFAKNIKAEDILFFKGENPAVSYADRKGKYQGQTGITLAKSK